ncbi:MAG: hypothetical protein LBC40_00580, partial [Dysgonamonadaceae bacterium]|nr:hypothetical protein [Dysgonamonadaceae bacterium]
IKKAGGKTPLTFEQFREWFDKTLPAQNEVIVLEESGTIGITKCLCVNEIVLGASLSPAGELSILETKIETTDYREASLDEKIRLQRELNNKGLLWNNRYSRLLGASAPMENIYLRVSLLGERIAVGVFREVNARGEIVMYCMKENGKPVRYSLYEVAGKRTDYQLEPVSAQERKMLSDELEKVGKLWNGYAKRIEPLDFRLEKGLVYFCIDDTLGIRGIREKKAPKDHKRWQSGNYYRDRKDAEAMVALIEETRKKQLIDSDNKNPKKPGMKNRSKKQAPV